MVGLSIRKHDSTADVKKTPLQLMGINCLVCGIEIASSCAFTYISPLLLKAGFSEISMTIILGIAPVMDLLTVPLLAEWSDQCQSKYGRRQPFICGLSVIVVFSLLLIPISSILNINHILGNQRTYMILLAVGVILFDYSYQALFNPCESLLVDVMASQKSDESVGFTIYSASLSLGCIIGYLVVSVDWSSVFATHLTREQLSFLIVTVLFVICLFVTLTCAREKSYYYYQSSDLSEADGHELLLDIECVNPRPVEDCLIVRNIFKSFYKKSQSHLSVFCQKPLVSTRKTLTKLISVGLSVISKVLFLPVICYRRVKHSPLVIRQLFYAELFGWTSVLCHNMFFTDFVGQYIYHGVPNAPSPSRETSLYDEGIQVGSWALFLQSTAACVYAFVLQQQAVKIIGPRVVLVGGMCVFGVCMVATICCSSIRCLNAFTALSGVGLAALTTVPNMLVTLYSKNQELYMRDMKTRDTFAYGSHVAVLDTAYFLSQVLLSLFVGPVVNYTKSSLSYLVVSALASVLSVWFGLRVVYGKKDLVKWGPKQPDVLI